MNMAVNAEVQTHPRCTPPTVGERLGVIPVVSNEYFYFNRKTSTFFRPRVDRGFAGDGIPSGKKPVRGNKSFDLEQIFRHNTWIDRIDHNKELDR